MDCLHTFWNEGGSSENDAGTGTTSAAERWAALFAVSAEEGAKTLIYLATSPEVEGVSGKYFVKQKSVLSSPASRDEAAARRLWRLSEELCEISAVDLKTWEGNGAV